MNRPGMNGFRNRAARKAEAKVNVGFFFFFFFF